MKKWDVSVARGKSNTVFILHPISSLPEGDSLQVCVERELEEEEIDQCVIHFSETWPWATYSELSTHFDDGRPVPAPTSLNIEWAHKCKSRQSRMTYGNYEHRPAGTPEPLLWVKSSLQRPLDLNPHWMSEDL